MKKAEENGELWSDFWASSSGGGLEVVEVEVIEGALSASRSSSTDLLKFFISLTNFYIN